MIQRYKVSEWQDGTLTPDKDGYVVYYDDHLGEIARDKFRLQQLVKKAAKFIGNEDKSTWGVEIIHVALDRAERLDAEINAGQDTIYALIERMDRQDAEIERLRFDPVCRKCGDPLTAEELTCDNCKG